MTNQENRYVDGIALVLSLFGIILLLSAIGHCSTTSHPNAFGAIPYTDNPMMYVAGSISDKPGAVSEIDGNLNLRINPIGTYLLYDESILFCGEPIDKFQGKTEPLVITYRRQATENVQGIGCHDLIRVDSLR